MPGFAATLIGFLALSAASLTGRVLLALGIGFVAYTGIDIVLSTLLGDITTRIGGLPAFIIQVLGVVQLDRAIQLLFSALTARLVISGLTSGALKRMVVH